MDEKTYSNKTGDLTLVLSKVQLSDAGTYHCFVRQITTAKYEEAVVDLKALLRIQVKTQDKVLVAAVGSEIHLPCTLSPPLSPDGLEVRWFHTVFHSPAFLMKDGREDRQQQNVEYRGRVSLQAGPQTGDLTLVLSKVRLSDAGTYHCFVEHITTNKYEEAVMELKVVGLGSAPLVEISLQDNSVLVSCSSSGWLPKPETQWKTDRGALVEGQLKTSINDGDGLYSIKNSLLLQDSSEKNLYCGARHNYTGQERGVYVTVSDAMFPRVSSWMVAFWLFLILALGACAVAAWKIHTNHKDKERQLSEKDKLIEHLRQEIEWRKASFYKEYIQFNPESAFRGLILSPDYRTISATEVLQDVPDSEDRFNTEPCVLARTLFTCGNHYWETEIQERQGRFWSLGIAKQTVRRAGGLRECPEAGIWAIRGTAEGFYALSSPHTEIFPSERPTKVGIFLNYEAKTVSFYDAQTYELLYKFQEIEQEPFYPFYYVGKGIAFHFKDQ
ncbi:butyrophilin subfamily 1 member A1-like [Rhinophrynus dorsalis]